ncbi:MAG: anti-sigma factor [Steroidobacteraceae bacterium]
MRPAPQHAAWIDRLAAEYVLGTLRGRARARFARWRGASALVDEYIRRWEQQLAPWVLRQRAVAPPPGLLAKIQRRLSLSTPAPARWAAALAVIALSASLLLYGPAMRTVAPDRLALINNSAGALQWRVELYAQRDRLVVRSPHLAAKAADRDFELWALPPGEAAVSLGVMPVRGELARVLSPAQRRALALSKQVAVSVEPLGGSPTGHTTGPVIFVVPLVAAG